MPVEVVTREEHQKVVNELAAIRQEVCELREQIGVTWIDRDEAIKLTGRSKTWFHVNRHKLPFAVMGGEAGSSRPKYCRAGCLKYGRNRGQLPPADQKQ